MAAVATVRRRPVAGVALLGLAGLATLAVGVPYGGLELVAAGGLVLFHVGRHHVSAWPGLVGVVLVAGSAALREGPTLRKLVVCLVVFGSMWVFGRLVRHRAALASVAVQEAERLARTDPEALVHPRAEAERRRVADGSAANLRRAVHDMVRAIDAVLDSAGTPGIDAVRQIRERGGRTVEELRHLLLILRDEPAPGPGPAAQIRPVWRADLWFAAAIGVVGALTLWRIPGWAMHPSVPVAYGALVAVFAVRRTSPLLAAGLLLAVLLPFVASPPADPESLLLVAAGIVAVLWELVQPRVRDRSRALALPVLGATCVVSLALGARYGVEGAGFVAAVLLSALAAGRAWGEPDRILLEAREQSEVLRSALARAATAAVQRERLRIAHDLHDATSHAVGVMLMQASAAEALLASSPERALAALATAREAGLQARAASNPLLPEPVLTEGEVDPTSLRAELAALVAQWRAGGMDVSADLRGPFPDSPEGAVACYRVVQEALTNCSRHAAGARVLVRIGPDRRHLLVEVTDSGGSAAVDSPTGAGLGLTGLRERVAAAHGQFGAGRLRGGGFRVSARLPLPTTARSRS
jgi:signal transduction histidine kinase